MKKHLLAILFIISGLVIMGMMGYDIYQIKNSQKQAMNNAMDIVFPKAESDYTDILINFHPKVGEVIGILLLID